MIREIFMPALSSTMTEGKITSWLKSPGDKVEKGETVLIVESDKADMDVESFYEGFLAAIVTDTGDSAPVGAAIGLLAEEESEIEAAKQQAAAGGAANNGSAAPAPAAAPAATPAVATATNTAVPAPATQASGRVYVSPRARKLAKQHGVDIKTIQGSGPNGRVTADDVQAAAGQSPAAPMPAAVASAPAKATPVPAPAPVSPGQTVPFTAMQGAVVRNMNASLEVPVFRASYTINTDGLNALYKQLKPKGVTMSVMLAKAVAVTLKNHPLLYASFAEAGTHYNAEINIAVAVAMDDGGLITPVLRQADSTDIYSLGRNWKDLVSRARTKQLQPDEYSTGTFTISNLGMFGVDSFDAILPPGTGSILAIGATKPTLVADKNGTFGIKTQMQVNITCDHRIIYGAHGAAFLKDLATLIETNPESLTM
ncbi:2-oxo acid dehydrogenase subunit E2 [filamentous cyanobacterium LEGE 11480]|uniref:Dihydrolipoamide acetyltransferase component of pyruvate dehydrogenase complex n=1 Tax=Romeriopsis navalis LEGE 11480 TaxID=2777977 RepID=A0A928Z231_9CYAN|nr:dihydrolipoamide acetyltransferase family protein [Romeriopsis navalis]MBE9029119.1 2-oxo acid dehydrogenase subunit E2 [Romeriopsis navalis LEGE 11480]